jgi:hypothetical protein
VAARPAHDVDARRSGHPPVEGRDVVLVELQLVDGVVTPLDGVHAEAVVLEPQDEDLTERRVVLRDEDPHRPTTPARIGAGTGRRAAFGMGTRPSGREPECAALWPAMNVTISPVA